VCSIQILLSSQHGNKFLISCRLINNYSQFQIICVTFGTIVFHKPLYLLSIEEKKRLLLHLDALIRSSVKGTAHDYAKKLGVSQATFFRLIGYMKQELDAPIV
jgi:hypothetical protein